MSIFSDLMSNRADGDPRALPRAIILELTPRCNNHCGYCYNAWRAPELEYAGDSICEMTTAEVEQVILRLREQMPISTIGLSGGEPTLRPDLIEIVRFIRSLGILPQIITNGTRLTQTLIDATARDSIYQIPLLSWRREVHDGLCGHPGAWNAVVEGMHDLHLAGGHVTAVFVATRANHADLGPTLQLAMMLGAESFLYNRINAGAANLRHAEELFTTPAMIEDNLRVMDDFAARTGFPISTGVVIEPCVVDVSRYTHIQHGWCPLASEESTLVIDPAGNIRICEHSPTVLGHVGRDSVRVIYEQHPDVEAFRSLWPAECAACDHPLRDRCRGGCKAASAQVYGTLERVDPFVGLNR